MGVELTEEEERLRVRELVKARRRLSGSLNQSLDTSLSPQGPRSPIIAPQSVPQHAVGTEWAQDAARMNEQFALIRAREEALLRNTKPPSVGHAPELAGGPQPTEPPRRDPILEKLEKQQVICVERH